MNAKYSGGQAGNIPAHDKLRQQQMRLPGKYGRSTATQSSQSGSQSLANSSFFSVSTTPLSPVFLMTATVQVGSPPTNFDLLVDTGSSNFVVGANPAGPQFVPSSSTNDLDQLVAVSYGSGSFVGDEVVDNVSLGGIATVQQSFGVPFESQGFDLFDGIIGLGLQILTQGTLINEPNTTIPTITNTLVSGDVIPRELAALTIPLASDPQAGSIDFGQPDFSKNTSAITFAPLVTTGDTDGFWSVTQSVTFGSGAAASVLVSETPGIIDAGTSLLLLPTAAFQTYMGLTNATLDPTSGLLTVESIDNLQPLFFTIGGESFEFSPNAQLFPRSLNAEAGLDTSTIYLIVSDGDTASGGIDFINGYVFLERFYSVFDTTGNQVGFATNSQTNANTN